MWNESEVIVEQIQFGPFLRPGVKKMVGGDFQEIHLISIEKEGAPVRFTKAKANTKSREGCRHKNPLTAAASTTPTTPSATAAASAPTAAARADGRAGAA